MKAFFYLFLIIFTHQGLLADGFILEEGKQREPSFSRIALKGCPTDGTVQPKNVVD